MRERMVSSWYGPAVSSTSVPLKSIIVTEEGGSTTPSDILFYHGFVIDVQGGHKSLLQI